jgi:hypothetical protein
LRFIGDIGDSKLTGPEAAYFQLEFLIVAHLPNLEIVGRPAPEAQKKIHPIVL